MKKLRHLFDGMNWYDAVEYATLMMMAVSVPISWRLGVWCMILFCIGSTVKIVASHHIGNRRLSVPSRICLWGMVLFYLLHLVSISYSSNPVEAWSTVGQMLPMLLLPLAFLLSDKAYLQQRHVDALTFLLAATLSLRFVLMLVRYALLSLYGDALDMFINEGLSSLVHTMTDCDIPLVVSFLGNFVLVPLRLAVGLFRDTPMEQYSSCSFCVMHHNYLSLYILTAISLLYGTLVRFWSRKSWHRLRWYVVADIVLLAAYVIRSDSRSGLVALLLLFIACLSHLALVRKQWRVVAMIVSVAIVGVGVSYLISPDLYKRAATMVKHLSQGEEGDVRQTLWVCGIEASMEKPLFGFGCDGYQEQLTERFHAYDCADGYQKKLNTHNQYIETLLTLGFVGLLVLLTLIVLPIVLSFRNRYFRLPIVLFTLVYAVCLMFEVTLARQMGLLFLCFWYCVMMLYLCPRIDR